MNVEKLNPMLTPNKVGLTKKEYQGAKSTLCTGCGHDSVTMHIVSAFYELDIPPHRVAKFSGIGCSSKTPTYFLGSTHGVNSLHGRMPSFATGAHAVNHQMINIGVSGDGDTASIGLGQFAHMVRRNIPILYIVENNGVYGLTKGQFSATARPDDKLKKGDRNPFASIDVCMMALELGCDYVGRSFSGDVKQNLPLIKGGLVHEGTAVLDVISPCITFNNHEGSSRSYKYVKEHDEILHEIGFVHGAKEIKVDYEPGETKEVEMHDGSVITLKKVERNYDPTDRIQAMELLESSRAESKLITGLFYVNPDTTPFKELAEIVDTPLVELSLSDLRPPKENLEEVMSELF